MREYPLGSPSEALAMDPDSNLDVDFISFEGLDNIDKLIWDTLNTISR
jgi:hypothetical protein